MNIFDKNYRAIFIYRLNNLFLRKFGVYYRRSYSQCGEDVIARTVFDMLRIAHPTYLDIGAHHPYYLSNTFSFYQGGSHGVNVEPDPVLYKKFLAARPNDVNLNVGTGSQSGQLILHIMSQRTLNTLSEKEARNYESQGYKIIEKLKIDVITINQIISENFVQSPDFLSIDVEGLDYEIITSLDFELYRPTLICVETINFSTSGAGTKNDKIMEFLTAKNYIVFADTYINTLYIDNEKWLRR